MPTTLQERHTEALEALRIAREALSPATPELQRRAAQTRIDALLAREYRLHFGAGATVGQWR
jgi:hypothetical protein